MTSGGVRTEESIQSGYWGEELTQDQPFQGQSEANLLISRKLKTEFLLRNYSPDCFPESTCRQVDCEMQALDMDYKRRSHTGLGKTV